MQLVLDISTQSALDRLLAYLHSEAQEVRVVSSYADSKAANKAAILQTIATEVQAVRAGATDGIAIDDFLKSLENEA